MSLLGIDVGTSGVKAAVFSAGGEMLASAYQEYDVSRPRPGQAELDAVEVWAQVKAVIRRAAAQAGRDPVRALAVSSLGEAVVPVTRDRHILGASILNFDPRGEEFLALLRRAWSDERLYRMNGNPWGNQYGLTKLMWMQKYQPDLYKQADWFLHWSGFVAFMLGGEPAVDYSLANRSLLFDLEWADWSRELLDLTGLDGAKLPRPVPAGTPLGVVSPALAAELGLPQSVAIAAGAHDQCANGLGCGVIREGQAMCGMGTYLCVMPVFASPREAGRMLAGGLNTEQHAAPGRYVSFVYNAGGSLLKWYRDTFAAQERQSAAKEGRDIYAALLAEMPEGPGRVLVLPHFSPTGPPEFIDDSAGVILGLKLETTRGEVLKGLLEGGLFYIREALETLPEVGIRIEDFRATGGGSKSDAWLQMCADILGRPVLRPRVTEAGALGAAILAGVGSRAFANVEDGVEAMVRLERRFEPDAKRQEEYAGRFARYRQVWPLLRDFLREGNHQT